MKDNEFGLKKPEVKPPVQMLNFPMKIMICGDLMYYACPMKNIYIPIPPEQRVKPKELIEAEEERMKFQEEMAAYNAESKELSEEYKKQLAEEMQKEMQKAQAKAAQKAHEKVKKSFKKRLGL